MDEKVKGFLQKLKERELIKRGLYNKKFYNVDEVTSDMEKSLKYNAAECNYYEIIPLEVSEEEYHQILKTPAIIDSKASIFSSIFYICSFLIFLAGFYTGYNISKPIDNYGSFQWRVAIVIWAITLFFSMVLIGIGKIIGLLYRIKNK